jgi:hypothetical protein
MSRHHEKLIAAARRTVAAVGQPAEQTDPMSREQIESFVKGFGLSAAATRQVVDRWTADQGKARDAGWNDHAESTYYDEQW